MAKLLRKTTPIIEKPKSKFVSLKRKNTPPPKQYCERVKPGELPAPITCTWVGEMYDCCRKCKKKVDYVIWKSGGYKEMEKELRDGSFDPRDYGI